MSRKLFGVRVHVISSENLGFTANSQPTLRKVDHSTEIHEGFYVFFVIVTTHQKKRSPDFGGGKKEDPPKSAHFVGELERRP
jgi:hypothetical protein